MKWLEPETWTTLATQHEQRARALTQAHLERRKRGQKHPVYDFLFEYYPVRVAHLQRWHPGAGVGLQIAAGSQELPPQYEYRDYVRRPEGIIADVAQLWQRRGTTYRYIRDLLQQTSTNPTHYDCFGLHEWAMVYQASDAEIRHDLPLRLGRAGTDQVVENHQLRCTHYDAFRFFTPPARPLNLQVLNRDTQPEHEQSGCLHAGMDLYKWATKLGAIVPGDLWLDTFELAWQARTLDMEASPYDCTEYGMGVVAIETPEGKATYIRRQREIAQQAEDLRKRLVAWIDTAEHHYTTWQDTLCGDKE